MTTKQTPTKPEPLSIYTLHSPADRRRHALEVEAYNDYVREEENRKRTIEQAQIAEANRVLTPDEYHAAAVIRETEKQARIAAREAEEKATQEAKAAYLASSPDVAEIEATNPYHFLLQVIHWANRGYQMPEGADIATFPTYYAVKLHAPAAPAKKAT